MKRLAFALLLALIVAFATGCPQPKYRPNLSFDQGMVSKFNTALKQQYREYECYRFGPEHIDFQNKKCDSFAEDQEKAKGIRNELIETALSFIDESYENFTSDIQAGRDRDNFLLDLVELGTTASIGITNGERTLQVLGVALTAFRGGRKSIDVNFYKETTIPILISKMDDNRARVRTIILRREEKSAANYTLGAAVSDLVDYFNAGTLARAFTQLQKDTAAMTLQTEAHLANLKAAGVKGAPTAAELQASREISAAFDTLWEKYRDARDSVKAQQDKIAAANDRIAATVTNIAAADQRIADANARVTAAGADQLKKAQAEADKSKAEADKAKAEANKTKAEAEKAAAETAKAAAITAKDTAFNNLKGTYEAIERDDRLSQLIDKVPNDLHFSPAFKAALESRIKRLKEKAPLTNDQDKEQAAQDYATILRLLGGMVVEEVNTDPSIVEHLQEILKANK